MLEQKIQNPHRPDAVGEERGEASSDRKDPRIPDDAGEKGAEWRHEAVDILNGGGKRRGGYGGWEEVTVALKEGMLKRGPGYICDEGRS